MRAIHTHTYALWSSRSCVCACATNVVISAARLVGIEYRVHSEAVASFLAHYWPPVLISLDPPAKRKSANWSSRAYSQMYDTRQHSSNQPIAAFAILHVKLLDENPDRFKMQDMIYIIYNYDKTYATSIFLFYFSRRKYIKKKAPTETNFDWIIIIIWETRGKV